MSLLLVAAVAAGCSGAAASPNPATVVNLSVAGAASLRDVLAEIETRYEAAVPGVTLTISTDSSAMLRTQIEQGAPVDVFLSADRSNPEALAKAALIDGELITFARNQLAIAVSGNSPAAISSPLDLARPGVRIIAAGDAVPITTYAQQVVASLATLPGYPPGFVAAYAANIVSKEDSVRAVVAKLELGEGDAAIVYATDVIGADSVEPVALPPEANVVAAYAGAVMASTAHAAEARAFLDWLAGPAGAAVFTRFGFLPAS